MSMMGQLAALDRYDPNATFDLRGRDPDTPPTMRERILDFERSPVGIAQNYYRKAHPDFGRAWADAKEREFFGGEVPKDVGQHAVDVGKSFLWGGPAEAATGLALGTTAARYLPGPLRIGAVAAGLTGSMMDAAEAGWIGPVKGATKWGWTLDDVLSSVKQRIPTSQLDQGRAFRPERLSNLYSRPEDLQTGGTILSLHGDRMDTGWLDKMLGRKVRGEHYAPGGVGFIERRSPEGAVWASEPAIASGYQNRIGELGRRGPVYGLYGPMGHHSIDFQPAVSRLALGEVARTRKDIDPSAFTTFDERMKRQWGGPTKEKPEKKVDWAAVPDWPGIENTAAAAKFLAGESGGTRNKFAKMLDRGDMVNAGMPNVSVIRHALTRPDVANIPNYAYGKGVAQLSAEPVAGYRHPAFGKNIAGENLGGWGFASPREVSFMDVVREMQDKRIAPHNYDFFFGGRMPAHINYAQPVTDEWITANSAFGREVAKHGEKAAFDKFYREGLNY